MIQKKQSGGNTESNKSQGNASGGGDRNRKTRARIPRKLEGADPAPEETPVVTAEAEAEKETPAPTPAPVEALR
jgi:hypothetical protein